MSPHRYQESYRSFSTHLAESRLLQWFRMVDTFDTFAVPTESTLQRFAQMYSSQEIQQINEGPLQLAEPIDLDTLFMDTTCVKANIHFPVDWVLLRDASKTIICGIECIRRHGLKHRIPAPESLIKHHQQALRIHDPEQPPEEGQQKGAQSGVPPVEEDRKTDCRPRQQLC